MNYGPCPLCQSVSHIFKVAFFFLRLLFLTDIVFERKGRKERKKRKKERKKEREREREKERKKERERKKEEKKERKKEKERKKGEREKERKRKRVREGGREEEKEEEREKASVGMRCIPSQVIHQRQCSRNSSSAYLLSKFIL